jgi:hypothetical protein
MREDTVSAGRSETMSSRRKRLLEPLFRLLGRPRVDQPTMLESALPWAPSRSSMTRVTTKRTADRRWAQWMVVVSLARFLLAAHLAPLKLAEIWAFIPSYQSAHSW